jgi:hypothetical protein
MKRGDRVLQLSFGSGFKCAAGYWKALRNIHDVHHAAWAAECEAAITPLPESGKAHLA